MSIERMQRLLQLTRGHDPELYSWLTDGWLEILDGHDPRDVLGFAGGRAIRNRDAALAELAKTLAPGRPRYAQADALADCIDAALAGSAGDFDERIRLLRGYGRIPQTQRHLAEILAGEQNEKEVAPFR